MSSRITELRSILSDIEGHIVGTEGYYDLTVDFDGWECAARYDDVDEAWLAEDGYNSEKCATKEDAIAWMRDSIDEALSEELAELESEYAQLAGILDDEIKITSINPQDSGWTVAEGEIAGDDIYAQTQRANVKEVSVRTAYEVYGISAAGLVSAAEDAQAIRELERVMTPAQIEKEFGLADGTVRQAIHHGRFARYIRPDERTILVRRVDAEARWKK